MITATSRSSSYVAALMLPFLVSGCMVRVSLLTAPPGATIARLDPVSREPTERCVAPCDWRFDLRPGHHAPLRITARGYVPLEVDMLRTEGPIMRLMGAAVFQRGGREITFLLVPEHAPLGTQPEPVP